MVGGEVFAISNVGVALCYPVSVATPYRYFPPALHPNIFLKA